MSGADDSPPGIGFCPPDVATGSDVRGHDADNERRDRQHGDESQDDERLPGKRRMFGIPRVRGKLEILIDGFTGQDHAYQRQCKQQHDQEHGFHDIMCAAAKSGHAFSSFTSLN